MEPVWADHDQVGAVMRMRVLSGLGAALIGVIVFLAWDATTERSETQSAAVAGHAVPDGCFAPVGSERSLQITSETQMRLDLTKLLSQLGAGNGGVALSAAPPQSIDRTRQWRLDLRRLQDHKGHTVLAAGIQEPETVGSAPDHEENLSPTFLIALGPRCEVVDFARWEGGAVEVATLQQAMVAELGFHLPPEDGSARYLASGFDFTGRYEAIYRLGDETPATLEARVLRYTEPFMGAGGARGALIDEFRIESSSLRVIPDSDTWVQELRNERDVSFLSRNVEVGFVRTVTEAHVTHADAPWDPVPLPSDGQWVWGILLGVPSAVGPEQLQDDRQAALRAIPLDEALGKFAQDIDARRGTPADWVGFMRDWLRANPEAVAELMQQVRDGWLEDVTGRVRAHWFTAMGEADVPQTRAALMELFVDETFPRGYALEAATALAGASVLPEGYFDRLVEWSDEGPTPFERGRMSLTLGLLADAQLERNPEAANRATSQLAEWIEAPRDSQQLKAALGGAGNAGSPNLVKPVVAQLDAEDSSVRGAAASALRRMPADEVQEAIAAHYPTEDDPAVRTRLLRSLATATRSAGIPISGQVVTMAGQQLGTGLSIGEFQETTKVLGIAARQGDVAAQTTLQQALDDALRGDHVDVDRIRTLGRYTTASFQRSP